jgi:ABC-type antimicrobial peptide transport system permease subunit
MRLLGMRRSTLVRLPIYQSITVVFLSAAFSAAVYFWISGIISGFTRRYLEAGETLALLPLRDLAWAGATALMLAVAAALVAGVRVLRVDPAEAIRDD